MVVEAAGVELITMLTARKLLIPGTATTAKKASLPDPLYVYCTKMIFALESHKHHIATTVDRPHAHCPTMRSSNLHRNKNRMQRESI